jgi:hypothetical protein
MIFNFWNILFTFLSFRDIGDSWTNTTKMCYLPPYNGKEKIDRRAIFHLRELADEEKSKRIRSQ